MYNCIRPDDSRTREPSYKYTVGQMKEKYVDEDRPSQPEYDLTCALAGAGDLSRQKKHR
jgi:hypothetical protein